MNDIEKETVFDLISIIEKAISQEHKNHKIVMEILDVLREALSSLTKRVADLENQNVINQASLILKEVGAE